MIRLDDEHRSNDRTDLGEFVHDVCKFPHRVQDGACIGRNTGSCVAVDPGFQRKTGYVRALQPAHHVRGLLQKRSEVVDRLLVIERDKLDRYA